MAKKLQVYYDGIIFDSEIEKGYYIILKDKQDKNEIEGLECHKEYVLIPPFSCKNGTFGCMKYTPDFVYKQNGEIHAVEIKGFARSDFEIRKKLFLYQHQDIAYHLIAYSKSTGYMEMKDYKKARRQIVIENEIQRRAKKLQDEKDRLNHKRDRYSAVIEKYKNRVLTKAQNETYHRAIQIVADCNYELSMLEGE